MFVYHKPTKFGKSQFGSNFLRYLMKSGLCTRLVYIKGNIRAGKLQLEKYRRLCKTNPTNIIMCESYSDILL